MCPGTSSACVSTKQPSTGLLISLLVTLLLPALYASFRVRLLNLSLDPAELGIVAQLQWIALLFEILKDSLLALVAFHLGSALGNPARFQARWLNALITVAITHTLLALLVAFFAVPLLQAFAYSGLPIDLAVRYLRGEVFSQIPVALLAVVQSALLVMGRPRLLYLLALMHLACAVAADSLLIPLAGKADGTSMLWVGAAPGLAAAAATTVSLYMLGRGSLLYWQWPDMDGMGTWLRSSLPAMIECALRNLVFAWMILRLVNLSDDSVLFWNTNQFIWTWILMPVFALGMLVRREAAISPSPSLQRPAFYIFGLSACTLAWGVSVNIWSQWIDSVMGYAEHDAAATLASSQIGFYLVFSLGYLLSQHFLGKGMTGVLLLNTAIVNLGYYGLAFLAFQAGLWKPELNNIVSLFGWGLVTGFLVLVIQYLWLQRRGSSTESAQAQPAVLPPPAS